MDIRHMSDESRISLEFLKDLYELLEAMRKFHSVQWTNFPTSHDKNKIRNLATFIKLGCPKLEEGKKVLTQKTGFKRAFEILKGDFIPPDDINILRHKYQQQSSGPSSIYDDDALQTYTHLLPCEEDILWCRDNGFALIAGPPRKLDFNDVCYFLQWAPHLFHWSECGGWRSLCHNDDKYKLYALGDLPPDWIMIRKEPLRISGNYLPCIDKAIPPNEYSPSILEVAWCLSVWHALGRKPIIQTDDDRLLAASPRPDSAIHYYMTDRHNSNKYAFETIDKIESNCSFLVLTARRASAIQGSIFS